MKSLIINVAAFTLFAGGVARGLLPPAAQPLVLKAEEFKHYVDDFNKNDNELYKGRFPNAAAWDFLKDNIPLLRLPG